MQTKLECFKSAVAFFFLFFHHGTSIGTRQQGISYNSPLSATSYRIPARNQKKQLKNKSKKANGKRTDFI